MTNAATAQRDVLLLTHASDIANRRRTPGSQLAVRRSMPSNCDTRRGWSLLTAVRLASRCCRNRTIHKDLACLPNTQWEPHNCRHLWTTPWSKCLARRAEVQRPHHISVLCQLSPLCAAVCSSWLAGARSWRAEAEAAKLSTPLSWPATRSSALAVSLALDTELLTPAAYEVAP